MKPTRQYSWLERNQQHLIAALQSVSGWINSSQAAPAAASAGGDGSSSAPVPGISADVPPPLPGEPPYALDQGVSLFHLSPFERDILLMCAGEELENGYEPGPATFSLAMASLPEAHWSAVTPAGPLRRWRLIELENHRTLMTSTLRIDERILHFLTGVSYMDERLVGLVEPVLLPGLVSNDMAPPSFLKLAQAAAECWLENPQGQPMPVICLCGERNVGKQDLAAEICELVGLSLYSLPAALVPANSSERETLARLWEREAALSRAALLLDCDDMEGTEMPRAVNAFANSLGAALIFTGREPPELKNSSFIQSRPVVRIDVSKPGTAEQRQLWLAALQQRLKKQKGSANGHAELDALVSQFRLSPAKIRRASAEALAAPDDLPVQDLLWEACRRQSRA